MSSPMSLQESLILLVFLTFISLVLSFGLGLAMDGTIQGFEDSIVFEVDPLWDSTANLNILINIFYVVVRLPAVLGVLLVIISATRRTEVQVESGQPEFQFQEFED